MAQYPEGSLARRLDNVSSDLHDLAQRHKRINEYGLAADIMDDAVEAGRLAVRVHYRAEPPPDADQRQVGKQICTDDPNSNPLAEWVDEHADKTVEPSAYYTVACHDAVNKIAKIAAEEMLGVDNTVEQRNALRQYVACLVRRSKSDLFAKPALAKHRNPVEIVEYGVGQLARTEFIPRGNEIRDALYEAHAYRT